jgi:hypothetical protein
MERKRIPYPMILGIAGLILGEIYMYFAVAGPRVKDPVLPVGSLLLRILALAPLVGGFGLAVGTGVGLLLGALLNPPKKSPPNQAAPQG